MTTILAPAREQARQDAVYLAWQSRAFPSTSTASTLTKLAPHLTPAGRTAALAALIDALVLADAIEKIAVADPWEIVNHLPRVDARAIPRHALTAYATLAIAADFRHAIATRDLETGWDETLDAAAQRVQEIGLGDFTVGELECDEVDLAHPDVLAENADKDVDGALGNLSGVVQAEMDQALGVLVQAVRAQVDGALTALVGGA